MLSLQPVAEALANAFGPRAAGRRSPIAPAAVLSPPESLSVLGLKIMVQDPVRVIAGGGRLSKNMRRTEELG